MSKSRYDYEQQHISDVKRIEEQNVTIQKQAETIAELTAKMNRVIEVSAKVFTAIMNEINDKPMGGTGRTGRKPKLTGAMIEAVKAYRDGGKTQREVAELTGLSVGLINKACNFPSGTQATELSV